jgi:hypothetical protein
MATNDFAKEEVTLFEDVLMGFDDNLAISKNVTLYQTDDVTMERTNDLVSRPMPYIMNSQSRVVGTDITAQNTVQRKVPCAFSEQLCVPFTLDAKERRDSSQYPQMAKSAAQRLASDIENSVKTVASNEGSLFVPITGAAGTYDNIAEAEALMLEQGLSDYERCLALSSRDYNGLAGNLSTASRSFGNSKSDNAYERSYVGNVAGFETLKMDIGKSIAAAAGGGTIDTTGAQVQYDPVSTADNRYQTVTVTSTTGWAAGDAFTIAGIEAVHQINKESTGQLKTFRVVSVTNGTTAVISPAIVGANSTPSDSELQYKNVEVTSTSATAAITFLNQTKSQANPFWCKESIILMPGRYSVPTDEGVAVMMETTESGIPVVMTKSFGASKFESLLTFDVIYGVTNVNPEMNGVILFNQ